MPDNAQTVLFDAAWLLLRRGQADGKHAYATPVFATVAPDGTPRSRTLVLRRADRAAGELWCYTDRRSQKAADLEHQPTASWTFWDKRHRLQTVARGPVRWLPEDEARARFRALPKHSRKSYATRSAPGTALQNYSDGLPPDWASRELAATDYAEEFFGVSVTTITTMDVLRLSRDGHERLRASRPAAGEDFTLSWIVP